jgi:hypothetical protein
MDIIEEKGWNLEVKEAKSTVEKSIVDKVWKGQISISEQHW